ILDCFRGRDPSRTPMVLVAGHGAFTWGKTAEEAVHHAVVLEEIARMAFVTRAIAPGAARLPEHLVRKHFERKHGADAYYGQGEKKIVLGISQIGAESEWRTANTKSIKESAAKEDITLKFSDAQQKQENQIKAIRSFIAQKVDVIAFSPVVETGWEPVLREAKAAKIPVILSDRNVDVKDDSLWVAFMGSDFVEEGRRAATWLVAYPPGKELAAKGAVNIVEL